MSKNRPGNSISVIVNEGLTPFEEVCIKSRLQRTSTYLSKRLFEPISPRSPLVQLERSTIKKSPTTQRNSISIHKNMSPKGQIHDHFNDNSQSKIINLPKLPYGKHQSYNQEKNFMDEHFLNDESKATGIQLEDLKKISKKFKMKKRSMSKRSSPQHNRTPETLYEEFRSQNGTLFVQKNHDAIVNYDKEKFRYSNFLLSSSPKSCRAEKPVRQFSPKNPLPLHEKMDLPFMFNCLTKPLKN
jgi:hypothetical protein